MAGHGDALQVGTILVEDYEVLSVLGAGGFGNTYLALDRELRREVAIKEYFPRDIAIREDQTSVSVKGQKFATSFQWGLDRFVQEAKLLAKFRHPNIVRVFRTFDLNGTAYIVLDYVRGPNMEDWLRALNRRPTQDELDEILAPLVDALILVHSAGILHRDIKPANICIREETEDPVLLDFGASKYSIGEMTGTTAAIVSRGYSPYEAYAADSKSQGAWTDLYGMGATVYRALMGDPPPEATERLLEDSLVPLTAKVVEGYRPQFLEAVNWALSVQPKNRPQTVANWQAKLLSGSKATARNWNSTRLLPSADPGSMQARYGSGDAASPDLPSRARLARRKGLQRLALTLSGLALLFGGGGYVAIQLRLIDIDWSAGTIKLTSNSKPFEPAVVALPEPQRGPEPQSVGNSSPTPTTVPEAVDRASNAPAPKPAPAPRVTAEVAPVATPTIPSGPIYHNRSLGNGGSSSALTVAAVSPDGRLIVGGDLEGRLLSWDVESGQETLVGSPTGTPVLAIDITEAQEPLIVAATADGRLAWWASADRTSKAGSDVALPGGFIRTMAYSQLTKDAVTIATAAERTRLARWRVGGEKPVVSYDIATAMVRAAAIAKNADIAVVVDNDENLSAFQYSSGRKLAGYDRISPAKDWTKVIAITSDGQLIARGGLYPDVTVYGKNGSMPRPEINLGEQAQTRWLAFSDDGKLLAIDYQALSGSVMRSRIRIVSTDSDRQILDLEGPDEKLRWLSFLPAFGGSYWLASTTAGTIQICAASETCSFGDRLVSAP